MLTYHGMVIDWVDISIIYVGGCRLAAAMRHLCSKRCVFSESAAWGYEE
jgi:hypothetical protein